MNKKFRDADFDLEYDTFRCLHGYVAHTNTSEEVQRITEIFDHPRFFPPGGAANSAAIRQGNLGDCYFLSALATVSSLPGLIEKICVARDEEVGVYGFIFYQDGGWVSVIVDDMLFTSIPKYESLDQDSKALYHEDKERFDATARKGGQLLRYAKAGLSDETWVALIEKAYAKMYGCFDHIVGGYTREAIEDVTGGVASSRSSRDILNIDRFWKDELSRANKDRLFACSFNSLAPPKDAPDKVPDVQGLYGNHAYAVLKAAEVNGKRFVVLRNPWGKTEWNGAWSDGSKEWTSEWLKVLPQLDHTFADDGKFVMEYKDFLKHFTSIERVVLFDDSWTVASCWLSVPLDPIPATPAYGTVSFRVNVPKKSKVIFVVSQLNTRAFKSLATTVWINLAFCVVRVGELKPLATGSPGRPWTRSGSIELELPAGEYVVYVKVDQWRDLNPTKDYEGWGLPKRDYPALVNPSYQVISKILTNKVKAFSLTQNWGGAGEIDYIAPSLEEIIKTDLEALRKPKPADSEEESDEEEEDEDEADEEEDEDDSAKPIEGGDKEKVEGDAETKAAEDSAAAAPPVATVPKVTPAVPQPETKVVEEEVSPVEWIDILTNQGEEVGIGLRVYTKTKDPAVITGRIKLGDEIQEY